MSVSVSTSFSQLKSYHVLSVTDRYYMVVRLLKVNREIEPGLYGKEETWTTSYFYISDLGVNCWISQARFNFGVYNHRRNLKEGKTEPKPFFPDPRPDAAIWVETLERPGGIFFAPYLLYADPAGRNSDILSVDTQIV